MYLYNSASRKKELFVPNHPDIDGQVYFTGSCDPGMIVPVRIERTEDGLLYGRREEARTC